VAGLQYDDFPDNSVGESISAVSAVLYEVAGQNLSGGPLFLQVHDGDAQPLPGYTPSYSYRVADQETYCITPPGPNGAKGRLMGNGIQVVWSTTQGTFTAPPGPSGTFFVAWQVRT
jgi:hypothetical protein